MIEALFLGWKTRSCGHFTGDELRQINKTCGKPDKQLEGLKNIKRTEILTLKYWWGFPGHE
jgi:hypothetical protein